MASITADFFLLLIISLPNKTQIKEEAGDLYIMLPDPLKIDAVLGTSKWMLRKAGEEASEKQPSNHIEIVAPTGALGNTSGPITTASSSGSCSVANRNLDW